MSDHPTTRILVGDCRDRLRELADESVDCVVTSPPYWGLRNYDVDGQIGLEVDFFDFLDELVGVFREVRRVLKKRGTCWINMGDSYASDAWGGSLGKVTLKGGRGNLVASRRARTGPRIPKGMKPKDMIGQPWRLAFRLQDDGWWLRQDIVWDKPSPMPESVKDRMTKAHEYLFLLSKSRRYHFDHLAIQEDCVAPEANTPDDWRRAINRRRRLCPGRDQESITEDRPSAVVPAPTKRNKRSVWTIPPQRLDEPHVASFPEELVVTPIIASCPAGGIVLDPFFGSGTTGVVAAKLGRSCIGIELNPDDAAKATRRIGNAVGLLTKISVELPRATA